MICFAIGWLFALAALAGVQNKNHGYVFLTVRGLHREFLLWLSNDDASLWTASLCWGWNQRVSSFPTEYQRATSIANHHLSPDTQTQGGDLHWLLDATCFQMRYLVSWSGATTPDGLSFVLLVEVISNITSLSFLSNFVNFLRLQVLNLLCLWQYVHTYF